jgi:hypothetical protein
MHNLTLAIDYGVLFAARKLALDQNTTVNQLVRDYLADLVNNPDQRGAARARIRRSMQEKRVEVGRRTWTSQDLHER